ncbi:MAG: EAL domain-containing protein [Pseudomonadota bacterium]|nr:EAL domain-containing protein [Pseudomonadota bacterium]
MRPTEVLPHAAIRTAFQPIVDLRDRSVYAYEALARGPEGEPASWVFAGSRDNEELGRLDHSIRVTAMRTARRLSMKARLSVNLFAQTEGCPSASIERTLEDAGVQDFPYEQLIFEITESAEVWRPSRLNDFIATHREYGFKTAIDDFGVGHAGLKLLSCFRPDIIKLDMQFTRHAPHDPRGRTLIRNMLAMATELGCEVIAEGVETQEESDILSDLGIVRQQGFLFSVPVMDSLPLVHWPTAFTAPGTPAPGRWGTSV